MRVVPAVRAHLVLAAAVFVTACASTSVTIGSDAAALRASSSAVRSQAQDAFRQANESARAVAIEHRLNATEPGSGRTPDLSLSEDDFPSAVAASDAAEWDRAFAELDGYFVALQSLVDPARARVTGDEVTALAGRVSGSEGPLPAGVGAAFATLVQNLIQARAEREATAVMRRLDPAFNNLTATMAGAIGSDNTANLRGTVWAHWEARLAAISGDYARATTRAARRTVIASYLQTIDARDAQLRNLEQLRASILALGEAHAAAARGSRGDVMFWLERIEAARADVERRRQVLAVGGSR